VVFQRFSKKPIFLKWFSEHFAYKNMLLGVGYQTLKTAGLYHVPIERYSKNIIIP
jgi:hypothetical protein